MSIRSMIARQFRQPRGLLGALAGVIMANRPSNRRRNAWAVERLDVKPDDRVLEIGCGPGFAIELVAARLDTGCVVGIDHSPVMIEQARRRNRAGVDAGKVELAMRGIDDLPVTLGGFTKIIAVNVLQFLPDLNAACAAITDIMAPGAMLAVTYQPRMAHPTREAAIAFGDRLAIAFGHAGLVRIRMEEMPHTAAPVITVSGYCPLDPVNGTPKAGAKA